MGLVPFLLPFVWVLESSSCGGAVPAETELTGTMLLGKFEVEGWLVVAPVLLATMLTPFFANRLLRAGPRVWVHLLGLVAAVTSGWGAFFAMFFTLFSEREARGLGWVVLGCFAGALLDALLRLGWSTQEWWRARPPRPASRAASG